jgi:hypothetical protein
MIMIMEPEQKSDECESADAAPIPRPTPPLLSHVQRDAEFLARYNAKRERCQRVRWRFYALLTVLVGTVVPMLALGAAGSMHWKSTLAWLTDGSGGLQLLVHFILGALGSSVLYWRGSHYITAMLYYMAFFIICIATMTTSMQPLLPAMPALVCIYIAVGVAVGFLTAQQDDD